MTPCKSKFDDQICVQVLNPWNHHFFYDRIPSKFSETIGKKKRIKFLFNQPELSADIVLVWGGLPPGYETLRTFSLPGMLWFVTEEAHSERIYSQRFLDQFDVVFSCRNDIKHRNLVRTHELNTWHMGITYDAAVSDIIIPKKKKLSIVCSDLTHLPGHKLRYAFANKLYGYFGDRIDFYGRAFEPIDDKWDALADYKYSIAIENSQIPGYFTEKFTECLLSHTVPVYFGAPDIGDFFPSNSYIIIDVNDFEGSVSTIEKLLREDPYEQMLPAVLSAKTRFLSDYHFFAFFNNQINKRLEHLVRKKKHRVVLKAENSVGSLYKARKIVRVIDNLIRKLRNN